MDFANLTQDYALAGAAAVSFVAGVLFARLVFGSRRKSASGEDPRNHRIRQLEVDLRLAERKLAENAAQLEARAAEYDDSMATVRDLNGLLAERNKEVEGLRKDIKSEVARTRELRRELSERAAETIREHVRAEEAQTELAVVRAGSDAIMSEFSRLQERNSEAD